MTSAIEWRGTNVATQISVLTEKSLRKLVIDPKLLLFSVLQPLILLVLFGQIFSSIANTPNFPQGVSYIDFLVPAILVNTAMQSALMSGVGIQEDIKNGVIARLRTLPIWLGSVLIARSLFDLSRGAIRQVILVVLAFVLFGFSPRGGLPDVFGAVLLSLVIGWVRRFRGDVPAHVRVQRVRPGVRTARLGACGGHVTAPSHPNAGVLHRAVGEPAEQDGRSAFAAHDASFSSLLRRSAVAAEPVGDLGCRCGRPGGSSLTAFVRAGRRRAARLRPAGRQPVAEPGSRRRAVQR